MLNSSNHKSSNSRKVVIYSRISKEADSSNVSSESLSLEAQSNLGHKYAEFNGHEVVGEFSEVFSGKNADNRPKFQKAIALAKKHKAIFFVYSLSRFGRNLRQVLEQVETFAKHGVDLYSHHEKVDLSTPSGALFMNIVCSFHAYELAETSHRTTTALAVKRNNNKRISGKIPFGYRLHKNGVDLIKNASEQKVIKKIIDLSNRKYSTVKIADQLNRENIKTATGKSWFPATVGKVLKRQRKLALV